MNIQKARPKRPPGHVRTRKSPVAQGHRAVSVHLVTAYLNPSSQVRALVSRLSAVSAAPAAEPAVSGRGGTPADELAPTSELVRNHHPGPARPWRLYDRLTPGEVEAMVRDRRDGATQKDLADKFGISVSSVQRVLRDHARR
ncbi:hypothetical protein [Glycomyces arizonensis]|uniref:hypothetical protein n=1 Tax=Glycomyces arizonensis TaxID=256035 RepID=UPI0012EB3FCB|nr:hypothetical protein [Glycomyces arizonensis]